MTCTCCPPLGSFVTANHRHPVATYASPVITIPHPARLMERLNLRPTSVRGDGLASCEEPRASRGHVALRRTPVDVPPRVGSPTQSQMWT